MSEKDSQNIKVEVVPLEEIEDMVKRLLLNEEKKGVYDTSIYDPLIILPGEYSRLIKKGEEK